MLFEYHKDDSIIHKEIGQDIFQSMMSLLVMDISMGDSSLGQGRRFVVIWWRSWPIVRLQEAAMQIALKSVSAIEDNITVSLTAVKSADKTAKSSKTFW